MLIANSQIERMDMAVAWERQCHAMDYPCDEDGVLSISEEAAERAAVAAVEAARFCGLVSVPTTPTSRAAWRVGERSRALRAALKATETDKAKARFARLRCKVGTAARCIQAEQKPGFRPDYCAMLTLTYQDGQEWCGTHLTRFVDRLRVWMKRNGLSLRYVWVAELQQRGAIHYHFALWLPVGVKIPKPDNAGWWTHGATRIEAAKDAVAYLMSYLTKDKTRDMEGLPRGARAHGAGGLEHAHRRARRWLSYPGWVKARADIHDDWRPALGGGWADPHGVVIPSEHQRAWLGDRWGALRVADYGRPFQADGPFEWVRA